MPLDRKSSDTIRAKVLVWVDATFCFDEHYTEEKFRKMALNNEIQDWNIFDTMDPEWTGKPLQVKDIVLEEPASPEDGD